MNLRNTRGRVSRITSLPKPAKKTTNPGLRKERLCSDSEDDLSFEEIAPFSPMSDVNNEVNPDGYITNGSGDEEYLPETGSSQCCKPKNMSKANLIKSSPKVSKKHKKANLSQSSDQRFNQADLELIIDSTKINAVKEVLLELPDLFAEEYCRYLFALQDKCSSAPDGRPRHMVFCAKANVLPSDSCVSCEKKFNSAKDLRKHIVAEHKTSEGICCTPCGKYFKALGLFFFHVTNVHSKNHQCPYCDLNFQGSSLLKKHLSTTHSCNRKFMCTLCKKGFDRGFLLMMHINVHTGLSPHKCQQCTKAYASSDSLREHMKVHFKERFQCHLCDKVFHSQKLLRVHLLTHGDERRYKCNLCDMAFKTSQNLFSHQYSHDSDGVVCSTCGIRYGNLKLWRAHCKDRKHGPFSEGEENEESNISSQNNSKQTADKKLRNKKKVTSRKSRRKTESGCIKSNESVISESIETDVDFSEIEVNKQPLQLEKTIFGDFKMDSESDEEEAVYELL